MLGAIVGDTVGSRFEFHNIKTKDFELTGKGTSVTDDSVMTVAVDECLLFGHGNEWIIDCLKKWGRRYPDAGYGGKFFYWVLGNSREPYNSFGNGSAMRVSGAGWFGESEEEVKALSRAVTQVTHNHPEGIKGAETVAMCIFYARKGKSREFIRAYAESQYPSIKDLDYEELRRSYFHGEEICQISVPQALYCFLISDSFEDCLRTTISIGGDCDTTAAMSCAIAEAFYGGIPENVIKEVLPFIPQDILDTEKKCYEKLGVKFPG